VSIAHEGLLHPVIVRPALDGKFEIVCGERRWRAFCQLAQKDSEAFGRIPARVVQADDTATLALMHRENMLRNDWFPWEKALFYKQAWESGRFASLRATSATLDIGLTTLHRYLKIFDLPKKYLVLFEKGILGMMEMELLVEASSVLRAGLVDGFRNKNWGKKEARAFLRAGEQPEQLSLNLRARLKAGGVEIRKRGHRITLTLEAASIEEAITRLQEVGAS